MPSNFWSLSHSTSLRKLAEWDDDMELERIECPIDPEHGHAGRRLSDLSIVLRGAQVEDVVWTWYNNCLLQKHVLDLFWSARLSGFEVKPVRSRFKTSAAKAPELSELVVTGWGGMASERSGIRLDEAASCRACGHFRYTGTKHPEFLIDPDSWDGSDFFMVWPLPKFIFVTDRVANLLRSRKVTGVRLLALKDLGEMSGFTPGRLSHWMPDERARKLGEPLGIF